MWNRTKRLINSYLDDLITRTSGPDSDVRAITRAEVVRLNELEVQARASAKVLEKQLAETELKIVGLTERERMARDRGDEPAASNVSSALNALTAERDLLKTQLVEAHGSAERARRLREERRRQGEDLASETRLTTMREDLAGIQSGFDPMDPASTIEEMRSRLGKTAIDSSAARLAEADREIEATQARSRIDELLAQYKQAADPDASEQQLPRSATSSAPPAARDDPSAQLDPDTQEPAQEKTLGPSTGDIKPID